MRNSIIQAITDKAVFYNSLGTIILTLIIIGVSSLFGDNVYWDNWIYTIPIFVVQLPIYAYANYKFRNVNQESKRSIKALKQAIMFWVLLFATSKFAYEIICSQIPDYRIALILFPITFIVGYVVGLFTKE